MPRPIGTDTGSAEDEIGPIISSARHNHDSGPVSWDVELQQGDRAERGLPCPVLFLKVALADDQLSWAGSFRIGGQVLIRRKFAEASTDSSLLLFKSCLGGRRAWFKLDHKQDCSSEGLKWQQKRAMPSEACESSIGPSLLLVAWERGQLRVPRCARPAFPDG